MLRYLHNVIPLKMYILGSLHAVVTCNNIVAVLLLILYCENSFMVFECLSVNITALCKQILMLCLIKFTLWLLIKNFVAKTLILLVVFLVPPNFNFY